MSDEKTIKKAGIIVGITIVILALVIWWVANGVIERKRNPKPSSNNKVQTSQTQIVGGNTTNNTNSNNTNNTNNGMNNNNSGNNTTITTNNNTTNSNSNSISSNNNVVDTNSKTETDDENTEDAKNNSNTTVQDVITIPKVTGSGIFQIVDESGIGTPINKEEIMIVASKKLLLLDSNINENTGKQLQYVVDVLTTNSDKISLYVNEVAYNLISVGSKLLVTYKIYTNDLGVEFPVIVDAQLTE